MFYSGNVINIQTGEWVGQMSGLGAGLDSIYEYMLKVGTNGIGTVLNSLYLVYCSCYRYMLDIYIVCTQGIGLDTSIMLKSVYCKAMALSNYSFRSILVR